MSPPSGDVHPATPSFAVHIWWWSKRRWLILCYQVRPPELLWYKTTSQKHLNIHTTLPALLFPGTIKKVKFKKPLSIWEYTLWLLTMYYFIPQVFIQHQDKALLVETAIRFVSQRNWCPLSSFQTFISVFCNGEEVSVKTCQSSSPAQSPHKLSAPQLQTCPYQNVEVPTVLCMPTSLLSWVTFRSAGKLLGFNLGSSSVHPVATNLTVSELSVPRPEQRRRKRQD